MGEQKSNFGLQGGNTVHKEILEFVLYYIRFDLQGGGCPPPTPTYAYGEHQQRLFFIKLKAYFYTETLCVVVYHIWHFSPYKVARAGEFPKPDPGLAARSQHGISIDGAGIVQNFPLLFSSSSGGTLTLSSLGT